MTVSEIEDIMRLPQATVSQQLARLRSDKLVTTRRDGRLISIALLTQKSAQLWNHFTKFFVTTTIHELIKLRPVVCTGRIKFYKR